MISRKKAYRFGLKGILIVLFFVFTFGITSLVVRSAEFFLVKDIVSRAKISTLADHELIIKLNTALAARATTTVTFPSGFDLSAVSASRDLDISFSTSTGSSLQTQCDPATVTSSPSYVYQTVTTTGPTTTAWNVSSSGQTISFQSPTTSINGMAASNTCLRLRVGSIASSTANVNGGTPTTSIVNPSSANTYTIAVNQSGGGDTGSAGISIVAEDSVTTTSSIDPSMTFIVGAVSSVCTINSSVTAGGALLLGTVSTTAINGAGYICTRVSTNARLGAAVQIRSINGALVSSRVNSDKIPSTVVSGSAGSISPTAASSTYGLCIGSGGSDTGVSAGQPPQKVSPYNPATCTTAPAAASTFGQLSTSFATIWRVTSTTDSAFANLVIKAAATTTTRSHADYGDTLIFTATATF